MKRFESLARSLAAAVRNVLHEGWAALAVVCRASTIAGTTPVAEGWSVTFEHHQPTLPQARDRAYSL